MALRRRQWQRQWQRQRCCLSCRGGDEDISGNSVRVSYLVVCTIRVMAMDGAKFIFFHMKIVRKGME
jgi:hypothetical protein